MKYEGDAVQYTAFALVAIESVWPNPDGNELSPDDADLSLINAESKTHKTDARSTFGVSSSSSQGVSTERDYHNKQGYYKILPLNVTNVRTSSSMNGSQFTATFTLDDLLLVTNAENDSAFRYATGLPMSTNDLVESDLQGALPMLVDTSQEKASWRYVKDEELGLARYRISGGSSSFNVEDLVDVNDTVTIWIYHDPQDFYFKDEVLGDNDFIDESGGLLRFNEKINNVIGSGDRRNQFSVESQSFDETLLGNLGITNEFLATSVEELLVADVDEETVQGQVPRVNEENIYDLINSFYIGSTTGILQLSAENKLRASVFASFPPETTSETSRNKILDLMLSFSIPRATAPTRDERGRIIAGELRPTAIREAREGLKQGISLLKLSDEDKKLFDEDISSYSQSELNQILILLKRFDIATLGRPGFENLIISLNLFALEIDKKTENYVSRYLKRKTIARSRQSFINGRTALVNESHGETPYLALKGSISSVEVGVGTVEGSYIVTVSGKGYEKVLQDNEIYYEDLLYPSNINTAQTDYHSIYVNMSPPRAIQHIVSRWAAKQVILGKSTTWSQAALNRYIYIEQVLTRGDDETNEGNVKLKNEDKRLLGGDIPVRGNFILSEFSIEPTEENVRVFSPINYLDTSRIQEMVRTLDRAYAAPDVEAAINTAVELDSRRSIMENLRKVGGVANFYQMFVDETGRLRYRLSFEAMERTPTPEYTPTIQDYDILAEGNSFSTDDSQLVTMVDVKPIVGQHNIQFLDLGFIGRDVPEKGEVPLAEVSTPDSMVSPELYRYGLRTLKIEDIYQSETGGAKRKAALYRGFFGQPLKKASVRLRNNTSYRVGETVLIALQKNKKRSRALIDLNRWIEWLVYLLEEGGDDLLRMYVGVDGRFLETGKNSFVLTSGSGYNFFDKATYYNEFSASPHRYVATQFLETFRFIQRSIQDVNVITPEYFPSTYWYYRQKPGGAYGWDENRVSDDVIIEGYYHAIRAAIFGGKSSDSDRLQELLTHGETIYEGPIDGGRTGRGPEKRDDWFKTGLINVLKFQDFRLASYFIESVSHNFAYGSDATTSLSLNYGQDTLAILDPVMHMPFGFISLEKKMRLGYQSPTQLRMWQDAPTTRSAIQNMYVEQFLEDEQYKKASFLYASQFLRNSSNLMYEVATVREGMDSYVDWQTTDEEDNTTTSNLVDKQYGTSISTTSLVSTDKSGDADTDYSRSTRRMVGILGLDMDKFPLRNRLEESGTLDRYIEDFANTDLAITMEALVKYVTDREGIV